MKAARASFLIIFFTMMATLCQAIIPVDGEENYCYKPNEPLFFSSVDYKKRYTEDLQEYMRCQQSFMEMQQRLTSLRNEAEENAQRIRDNYESKKITD